MTGRLLKLLLVLVVLGLLGLVGFAYLGDLDPVQERVTEPVELELSE
jgi:Tfp pilus assembly protein PilX